MKPVLEVKTATAPMQSHDHISGSWQLAQLMIGYGIPQSLLFAFLFLLHFLTKKQPLDKMGLHLQSCGLLNHMACLTTVTHFTIVTKPIIKQGGHIIPQFITTMT